MALSRVRLVRTTLPLALLFVMGFITLLLKALAEFPHTLAEALGEFRDTLSPEEEQDHHEDDQEVGRRLQARKRKRPILSCVHAQRFSVLTYIRPDNSTAAPRFCAKGSL